MANHFRAPLRVGTTVDVLWADARWYRGTLVANTATGLLVHYDDNDEQEHAHAEHKRGWVRAAHVGAPRRGHWPCSLMEALEQRWVGYKIPSVRGALQTYRPAVGDGVGLRLAPQARPLPMPPRGDEAARQLLWFEGTWYKGQGAVQQAARQTRGEAPEVIEDEAGAFAPLRQGAQLAECAVGSIPANCELGWAPRGEHVRWPVLLQTADIAPGEPLRWLYNDDSANPMHRKVKRWGRAAEREALRARERTAVVEVRRRELLRERGRSADGTFKRRSRHCMRCSRGAICKC